MSKPFTGYHVSAILIAFFAVVVAVNVTMARLATSTFGGALAENGYVASQEYNKWIAESAAQSQLGWTIATRVEQGHLLLDTRGIQGAAVEVIAEHPLGQGDDQVITMKAASGTEYRSLRPMPIGRWKLRVVLARDGKQARYLAEVRA